LIFEFSLTVKDVKDLSKWYSCQSFEIVFVENYSIIAILGNVIYGSRF
jgi:hypothetical protein